MPMTERTRTETLRKMQEIRRQHAEEMDANLTNEKEYQLAKARFWAANQMINVFLGME
jgi:hypothetical protein